MPVYGHLRRKSSPKVCDVILSKGIYLFEQWTDDLAPNPRHRPVEHLYLSAQRDWGGPSILDSSSIQVQYTLWHLSHKVISEVRYERASCSPLVWSYRVVLEKFTKDATFKLKQKFPARTGFLVPIKSRSGFCCRFSHFGHVQNFRISGFLWDLEDAEWVDLQQNIKFKSARRRFFGICIHRRYIIRHYQWRSTRLA